MAKILCGLTLRLATEMLILASSALLQKSNAALRMCEYLLSVGVMLPLMAVLSAAWIEVDPESCTTR